MCHIITLTGLEKLDMYHTPFSQFYGQNHREEGWKTPPPPNLNMTKIAQLGQVKIIKM